jgi:SET domain-containing protein
MTRCIVIMIAMTDRIAKTRVQKGLWEKVEVRHTKDGKGSSLFAIKDIDKDDYVIKYVRKIEYKRRENNYMMKINGMNLWINLDRNGGRAQYMNHSCNSNCELVQWGVDSLPGMCFFAKENIKSGMEFTVNYNWDWVSGQVWTVCLCGSENCDGYIEKKDAENNLGMSEYGMNGILRCKIQFRS